MKEIIQLPIIGDRMPTVNSLSSGKTSSYMATLHPADYEVFSLVRIEHEDARLKDKKMVQYIEDKIQMPFIATAENDLSLYVMRDLEQLIGREIHWVTGPTFDEVIGDKNYLPNVMSRFCTVEMKLYPIFIFCYQLGKVRMRIGYRGDEIERQIGMYYNHKRGEIKYPNLIEFPSEMRQNKNGKWIKKNAVFDWRCIEFPFCQRGQSVFYSDVQEWAEKTGIKFPKDSNCEGCFHKNFAQIQKNLRGTNKANWWIGKETKVGSRFKKEDTYDNAINKMAFPLDMFSEGYYTMCDSGGCTD